MSGQHLGQLVPRPWENPVPYLVPPALSTLNGPRGLLGMLTLIPKFTGEKMQPLEQGEGSHRPPVISCAGSEPGDQGPGLQPPLPHGTWGLGRQQGKLPAGTPPSLKGLCQCGEEGTPRQRARPHSYF